MRAFVRLTAAVLCGAFLIVTLSGCYTAITRTEASATAMPQYEWAEGITLPIPPPKAELAPEKNAISKHFDTICCEGVTEKDLLEYLSLLQDEGFELLEYEDIGIYLIRGNETIDITDQSFTDDDDEYLPYIDVIYNAGYQGPAGSRVGKEQAKELISDFVKEREELDPDYYYYTPKNIYRLAEQDDCGAYEKMGLQVFRIYENDGPCGVYYVCNGCVDQVYYDQLLTADIDNDGEYELLSVMVWDGGSCFIVISAYKYGLPLSSGSGSKGLYIAYQMAFIPDSDKRPSLRLRFRKVSETEVHLCAVDYAGNEEIITADYGALQIDGDKLFVSAEDFPYIIES